MKLKKKKKKEKLKWSKKKKNPPRRGRSWSKLKNCFEGEKLSPADV